MFLEEIFSDHESFCEHDTEYEEVGDSGNEDVNNLELFSSKEGTEWRKKSHGDLVVTFGHQIKRVPDSKPDSTEDPSCMEPAAREIIRSGQMSSRWCDAEVWRGVASSDPPCMGPVVRKSYLEAKRPPASVERKFGEGVPAQVSSSSSDRDSELRGQSQNSPPDASKRDLNITQ
ncbi:hypothetical protein AVEN_176144-1 [Araneus ventricosus]|uniref:Uncharacterized protein n=1 Tax=Araneus ventricosus TaxID=182803 RepID=A0A4Y2JSV5_ARAVE|nr:hypothetical protein AVEN_176144-1 [Araneus ventricosus]